MDVYQTYNYTKGQASDQSSKKVPIRNIHAKGKYKQQ
jgi:hypothetical protein